MQCHICKEEVDYIMVLDYAGTEYEKARVPFKTDEGEEVTFSVEQQIEWAKRFGESCHVDCWKSSWEPPKLAFPDLIRCVSLNA